MCVKLPPGDLNPDLCPPHPQAFVLDDITIDLNLLEILQALSI